MDLIALTTAMAVTFTFQAQCREIYPQHSVHWIRVASEVVGSFSFGLPIAAIYHFYRNKRSQGQMLLHPGHWLLFSYLSPLIGSILFAIVYAFFAPIDQFLAFQPLWLILAPFALGGFILAVLGATRQRGIWLAVFVVWGIMFLFSALHFLVISFGNLLQFSLYDVLEIIRVILSSLIAILLFVAFIKDLKQQIPRNV